MPSNKKATNALIKHKVELEEKNHNNIVEAIVRIKNAKTQVIRLSPIGKVTVANLAKESGVSRASLYGNHKSLLDELEKINSKRTISINEKRKIKEKKIDTDKELIKDLTKSKQLLAQENYSLNEQNKTLKRQVAALIAQLGSKENVIAGNFKR